MSEKSSRTLQSRVEAIGRMIRALPRDASEWDATDLVLLDRLERDLNTARTQAVHGLREHGYSDVVIGRALGISRQAVSKRWPGDGRYVGAAGRYRTHKTPQETSTS